MDWYTILKFLHVVTAIVWVGGGFLLALIAIRAERADDREAMLVNMRNTGQLGNLVMMPSALLTLVFGLLMCWFWVGFTDLWIVIGLAGYATTFVIGAGIMKPTSDRLAAIVEQEGMTASAMAVGRRMLQIAKFDYTVMLVIVAAMVLKPTLDDLVVLGGMTAVLIAGAVLFLVPRSEPALPAAA